MPANPTVVFTGPRQVAVEDRPMPEPTPGQVLIRTHTTLVSIGTELSLLAGDRQAGRVWERLRDYPITPGYDNVGTVVGVGDGVDASLIGRRVASYGPHAAYVCVGIDQVWRIPDEVSDDQAAFTALAQITLNGLRRSGLVFGESAVVFGLGLLGQLTAQLCLFAGASPVFGVDASANRASLLPADPRVITVATGQEDPAEVVAERTAGRMADVVFELTGSGDVLPTEVPLLRPQGRLVVLSSPRSPSTFDFHDLCNSPSITIIGAHNSSHPNQADPGNPWTQARHAELFFDLLACGVLDLDRLISYRFEADRAPDAYALLLADRTQAMGVLLTWTAGYRDGER